MRGVRVDAIVTADATIPRRNDRERDDAADAKSASGWPVRLRARAALALTFAILLAPPADAASFPDRPIKLIVPFAPGGPPDVAARIIGDWLSAHLGPVVVENHIGAGGTLAARLVAGAAAGRLHADGRDIGRDCD